MMNMKTNDLKWHCTPDFQKSIFDRNKFEVSGQTWQNTS